MRRRLRVTVMRGSARTFGDLCADRQGATAIEYALIGSMVAVAAMGAMSAFGDSLAGMWSFLAATIGAAMAGAGGGAGGGA